jgi:hypothetical protein
VEQLPPILSTLLDQSPAFALLAVFIWALYKGHAVMGWQYKEKGEDCKRTTELLTSNTVLADSAVNLAERNLQELKRLGDAVGANTAAIERLIAVFEAELPRIKKTRAVSVKDEA